MPPRRRLKKPCKPWTGRIDPYGYGRLSRDKKGTRLRHRQVWIDANGPIPDGMTVDHLCHDPKVCNLGNACPHRRCVELEHLALVPIGKNSGGDRSNAGRHWREKTHCPREHPYDEANTLRSGGKRFCKQCRKDRWRAAKE